MGAIVNLESLLYLDMTLCKHGSVEGEVREKAMKNKTVTISRAQDKLKDGVLHSNYVYNCILISFCEKCQVGIHVEALHYMAVLVVVCSSSHEK